MQKARFWAKKNAENAEFTVIIGDLICIKDAVSHKKFLNLTNFLSIALYYTILYYTAMPLITKTSISDVIINSPSYSNSYFHLTCGNQ